MKEACVSGKWEFSSPMTVHVKKSEKRGLMEGEMHLTWNRPMTIRGNNPCKCMKTHHNDGNSKQTLAVAIEDDTHHCMLSDESTNVKDDNDKSDESNQ